MTNPRIQRTAADEEQRIATIVDRKLRETFKNGMPSGSYSSYFWDGMKIVGSGSVSGSASTPGAKVFNETGITLETDTAPSLNFDQQEYDDADYWDETPGSLFASDITVPNVGYYLASYTVIFDASTTGEREAYLSSSFTCGADVGGRIRVPAAQDGTTILSGSHIFRLAAGCVIRLFALQTTGSNLLVTYARCTVVYLGPPTELVSVPAISIFQASGHLSAATSSPTVADAATTQIDFNIVDEDPYTQMSGSTFTAATAMDIVVSATYAFNGPVTPVGAFPGVSAGVYKNGSLVAGAGSHELTTTGAFSYSGSSLGTTITLAPGDTIILKMHNFSGQTLTYDTAGTNTWTITKVG